ncbi:MFS transporter [Phenylobacterium sp. SCN 70-31]|uniref:MFS transporter n=1 Tax=Phenylobacterium sp. SCN 70-31 TaxID=1660129 RepID=UPI0025CC1FDF|nr:MFS transporter [Phenylobacterium sp. SCN 70-31]
MASVVEAASDPKPANLSEREGRLPLATKLSYGLGEAAEGVKTAALETFLFFFYVQVVGLSGSLTGLALLIALVFDGITDPIIGNISDNFRSRLGRRHPFLYLAPVPLAICLFLLFSPPDTLGQWGLFAWLLGFTAVGRLMQSFYFVPHMALGAELSSDFKERVSVSGYRAMFAYIGRLAVLGLAFSLFFRPTEAFPNGQLNPEAYQPLALFCGAIVIVVIFVSALGTQRRAQEGYARGAANGSLAMGSGGLIRNLLTAFRLKAFTIYFVAILISYVLGGVQAALNIHLNTYFWRLPPTGVQMVLVANVFGFMAGAFIARALAHRFDKKPVYVACVVFSVIVPAATIGLGLAGVIPLEDKGLLTVILATSTFVSGFIGGPAVVVAGAMLADVADAYHHRFRGRSEGFLFGASAFTRKASLGVGGAIAGVALDVIRFPRGVPVDAVPHEATVQLAVLYGPAMLIFTCISMSIMWAYPLSRQRHAEILADLEREERAAMQRQ